MIENKRDTLSPPYDQSPVNKRNMTISHAALLADMEQVFTEARPHLLRLAHLNGMSPDMAEDVVQEPMMEAWRHVESSPSPGALVSPWWDTRGRVRSITATPHGKKAERTAVAPMRGEARPCRGSLGGLCMATRDLTFSAMRD